MCTHKFKYKHGSKPFRSMIAHKQAVIEGKGWLLLLWKEERQQIPANTAEQRGAGYRKAYDSESGLSSSLSSG